MVPTEGGSFWVQEPENNHRWCKPLLTTLRRCSPTLTVHGCNKVLRSSRWQRHSLWALISLWVISLRLQFQPYVYTDALYFARLVYFLSIILRSSCYSPLSASFWFFSSIFFHDIFKHLTWDLKADDFREPTYSSIQLWGALRNQLLENFFFSKETIYRHRCNWGRCCACWLWHYYLFSYISCSLYFLIFPQSYLQKDHLVILSTFISSVKTCPRFLERTSFSLAPFLLIAEIFLGYDFL